MFNNHVSISIYNISLNCSHISKSTVVLVLKKYHAAKTTSTHSEPLHWMELSDQLHAPAALHTRKEPPVPS